MLFAALCWLAAVNAWTMFCFWWDKRRAIDRVHRIAERDLLWLSVIGGSPGAFAGRHLFRHKTRKEPFSTQLMMIAAAQTGVVLTLVLF